MVGTHMLLQAINQLEALLSDCVGLATGDASDQRMEMVRLRQSMTDHTYKILEIGLQTFNSESSRNKFHAQHSELLSAIARHQSEWPISSYDAAATAYKESLLLMRDAYQNFAAWVSNELRAN